MANLNELKTKVHQSLTERDFELRKGDTEEIVDVLLEDALELLVEQGELKLGSKWGKFEVVERAARKGINPQTKEEIEIPAKKAPKFSPSKGLKEAVL